MTNFAQICLKIIHKHSEFIINIIVGEFLQKIKSYSLKAGVPWDVLSLVIYSREIYLDPCMSFLYWIICWLQPNYTNFIYLSF